MSIQTTTTKLFSRISIGIFASVILIASLLCLNSIQLSSEAPCGGVGMSSHDDGASLCDSPLNHVSLSSRALPQSTLSLFAFFLLLSVLAIHFEEAIKFFNHLKEYALPPPRPKEKNPSLYRNIFVYLLSRGILHTKVYEA